MTHMNLFWAWLLTTSLIAGISCAGGYATGYEARRRDACVYRGGRWMEDSLAEMRPHVCVGGTR